MGSVFFDKYIYFCTGILYSIFYKSNNLEHNLFKELSIKELSFFNLVCAFLSGKNSLWAT